MSAPELNNKVNVSISLIVALVIAAFSLGGVVTGLLGLESKINQVDQSAKDYIEQEVGGLRSDWERQNAIEKEINEALNKRIDRKIENHEAVYHQ